MAKKIVFLLHGMGDYSAADWHVPYVDAIRQAHSLYPLFSDDTLDDRAEFVAIEYDSIFRDLLDTWASNAALVKAASLEAGVSLSKLTQWLAGAGELKDNFAWTHAADVLLYRAFSLVRNRVCVHVARQITTRLKKAINETGSVQWAGIGHSLGTAVLHDTLARLWHPDSPIPGAEAFAPHNVQADLIMMVANVTRVLEVKTAAEPYDVFQTAVAPGFGGQSQRGCKYYLTARHRLDPFTVPKMFDPQMWPDEAALMAQPPRYMNVEVNHLHDRNVHDFGHYLKHPAVHIPMLRALFGFHRVSADHERDALLRWRNFGPLEDAAAIKLKTELESLLPSQADDWLALGKLKRSFEKVLKK